MSGLASPGRGLSMDEDNCACVIAGLVDEGLATAQREIVTAPGRTTTEVVRIRISDAGRKVLEG